MKLKFKVHRATSHMHDAKAVLADGTAVEALVPTMEIEMVPISGQAVDHASCPKFAFQGALLEEAKKFADGDVVEISIDLVDG